MKSQLKAIMNKYFPRYKWICLLKINKRLDFILQSFLLYTSLMNLFSIKKRTVYEFRFFVSDDIPTHFSCLLQSCSVHHKHVLTIHEIIRAGVIPLNEVNHRLFRFAHYEEALQRRILSRVLPTIVKWLEKKTNYRRASTNTYILKMCS